MESPCPSGGLQHSTQRPSLRLPRIRVLGAAPGVSRAPLASRTAAGTSKNAFAAAFPCKVAPAACPRPPPAKPVPPLRVPKVNLHRSEQGRGSRGAGDRTGRDGVGGQSSPRDTLPSPAAGAAGCTLRFGTLRCRYSKLMKEMGLRECEEKGEKPFAGVTAVPLSLNESQVLTAPGVGNGISPARLFLEKCWYFSSSLRAGDEMELALGQVTLQPSGLPPPPHTPRL